MHKRLVNRLGGLSLPRKSVVRLTDRPDMTLDVYRGRKTTMQQQQQLHAKREWGLKWFGFNDPLRQYKVKDFPLSNSRRGSGGKRSTVSWAQLIKGGAHPSPFLHSKKVPIYCWVDRESFPSSNGMVKLRAISRPSGDFLLHNRAFLATRLRRSSDYIGPSPIQKEKEERNDKDRKNAPPHPIRTCYTCTPDSYPRP